MAKKLEKLKELAEKYRDGLDPVEKARYDGKLKLLEGEDPYEMLPSKFSDDVKLLPKITYPDIVNYLIFSPSPYTSDDLKSYKGLDAYNQFVSGWVRDKASRKINDKIIVKAKVLHSQRMSEKPLQPWIIAEQDGKVLAAHCTCMAGLGEACTHVASLLFAFEATVKLRDSKTVTEEKSYWLLPSSIKNISYKEVRDMNFSSAKTMKKKLDSKLEAAASGEETATTQVPKAVKQKVNIPQPSIEELSLLFKSLNETDSKPGILALVPEYSNKYIPQSMNENFPPVLTELRDDNAIEMNYMELLKKCQTTYEEIKVTKEQAQQVEQTTREQSNSKLWFRFRAGRITASKMKTVYSTDPTYPAQSMIKSVCYPESYKFSSDATTWGCQHEKFARDIFIEKLKEQHTDVEINDTGFFINPTVPFIGSSPDGIVSCSCCGQFIVEIKCPFCKRLSSLDDAADEKGFYLVKDNSGNLKLDKKHMYYYQVQTQLGVCEMECAYFVVWTEKDLHIEQIQFDPTLWQDMCEKAKHIFITAILPELIGKFYSRLPFSNAKPLAESSQNKNKSSSASNTSSEQLWCFCAQVESGRMIFCDNEECPIQWFHYLCLGISCAPKGKWYCPDCRKLPQFKCRRGKKTSQVKS